MLSFIDFHLICEAKVDDLAAQHPEQADAIRAYNDADPTPTKKFLPWLFRQHMRGNVTPEDARLHSTLQNFDKFSHKLPSKDHHAYNFNDLANKVGEHIQKHLETKKNESDVHQIYKEPDSGITAQHIRTNEASKKLYGGGEARKGTPGCDTGTSWCVSARSDRNLYGNYGPLYTIHAPHDPNAPYAVHPMYGSRGATVTDRHNKGDKPYDEVVRNNPHIKSAVEAIIKHSGKNINAFLNDPDPSIRAKAISHPDVTPEQISHVLSNKKETEDVRVAAAAHKNATAENINQALKDPVPRVRQSALTGKGHVTAEHIEHVLSHDNEKRPEVRAAAAAHPKATSEQLHKAMADTEIVRRGAMKNPNAGAEHLAKGVVDDDQMVRQIALNHQNITPKLIEMGKNHEGNIEAMREWLKSGKASKEEISKALKHPDDQTRKDAARAPNASPEHIHYMLDSNDHVIKRTAAQRPDLLPEHIDKIIHSEDAYHALRGIEHPRASQQQIESAFNHPKSSARQAAYETAMERYPEKAAEYAQRGVKDPKSREAVLHHKSITSDQLNDVIRQRPSWSEVRSILKNPNITNQHLHSLMDHTDSIAQQDVLRHKKADSSLMKRGLEPSVAPEVRRVAIKSKHTTPEIIKQGLADPDKYVAIQAAKHKNASDENIKEALNHRLPSVRLSALKGKNVTDEHRKIATNNKFAKVRALALSQLS